MFTLILLSLAPFVWLAAAKAVLHHRPSPVEWSASALLSALLVVALHSVSGYQSIPAREIANGQVLDKAREDGEAGPRWVLVSQVGKIVVPEDGETPPMRYRDAKLGDPVAQFRPYVVHHKTPLPAWLTVFDVGTAEPARGVLDDARLPSYPDRLDGWTLDRVVLHGISLPEPVRWNRQLANLNGRLGPLKDANVILVLTHDEAGFAERLRAQWTQRQPNDVIAVLGVRAVSGGGFDIDWAHVVSEAGANFNVELEARLVGLRQLSLPAVLLSLSDQIEKNFTRAARPDTAALAQQLDPPADVAAVSFLIALLAPLAVTVLVVRRRLRTARKRSNFTEI